MQKRKFVPEIIRHLLFSWLLATAVEYLLLPEEVRSLSNLDGLAQMSFARVLLVTGGGAMVLHLLSLRLDIRCAERWGMVCLFGICTAAALKNEHPPAFTAACILIAVGLTVFALRGWDSRPKPRPAPAETRKLWLWITAGAAVLFFLFVSAWSLGRLYSFCSPTYDFGIFAQMFHSMDVSGLPVTTLERDGLLSHFAVHMSPIYYLMLPVYKLIPDPATLQVLQAAVMTSAVIPLWKIAAHHGLSGAKRMLVCVLFLLYPAFSGGAGYDLHENCFLTPLLLWLFYGIDRKNWLLTTSAALLTLAVKEDAAVYVAVIALWLIVRTLLRTGDRPTLTAGLILLAGSLLWFLAVTGYLAASGDGVMAYRYQNFMYDGSGSLLTVVKAVILAPLKAVYECTEPEKLSFLALTLLPLLGLPLFTRRYEHLLLLIPYLLVNLMSDYQYQHHIFFQYTFGSTACLLYVTVNVLADCKTDRTRLTLLLAAVLISGVCFGRTVVPEAVRYPARAIREFDTCQQMRNALAQIPDDAAVTAHTFYTAQLSRRDVLYDLRYASIEHLLESDYVVIQASASKEFEQYASQGKDDGYENLIALLEENGYRQSAAFQNGLQIYVRMPLTHPPASEPRRSVRPVLPDTRRSTDADRETAFPAPRGQTAPVCALPPRRANKATMASPGVCSAAPAR